MGVFPRRNDFETERKFSAAKLKLLEGTGTSWTITTFGKSVPFMETLCASEHRARNENRTAGGSNRRREEFENSRNRSLSNFSPNRFLFPRAPVVVWLYYITGIKAWPPFSKCSGILEFIYPIPVDFLLQSQLIYHKETPWISVRLCTKYFPLTLMKAVTKSCATLWES